MSDDAAPMRPASPFLRVRDNSLRPFGPASHEPTAAISPPIQLIHPSSLQSTAAIPLPPVLGAAKIPGYVVVGPPVQQGSVRISKSKEETLRLDAQSLLQSRASTASSSTTVTAAAARLLSARQLCSLFPHARYFRQT